MMTATTMKRWNAPTRQDGLRALALGSAWALMLTAGLTAMSIVECGMPDVADVATTGAVSLATGVVAIGPLALLARRRA
jgi:hypothetical protein